MPSVILASCGYDNTIRFWEAPSGICYRTIQYADSHVNKLALTPDKQYLAAAGNPHIRLFEVAANNPTPITSFEGHTNNVTAIGFQKHGKWMYSGSEDHTIKIWDLRAPGAQREYKCTAPVNDVVLHPNQAELFSADADGNVRVWDLTANVCSRELVPAGDVSIRSLSVTSDGARLAAANNTGHCFIWGLYGDAAATTAAAAAAAATVAAPAATTAAAAAPASTAAETAAIERSSAAARAAAADGANDDEEGAYAALSKIHAHNTYILKCMFSPDGKTLATTSADHTIKMWSAADFTLLRTLAGHQRWVWDAVFSADSAYLVTVSSDHTMRLWDLARGETVRHYTGHHKGVVCVCLCDREV